MRKQVLKNLIENKKEELETAKNELEKIDKLWKEQRHSNVEKINYITNEIKELEYRYEYYGLAKIKMSELVIGVELQSINWLKTKYKLIKIIETTSGGKHYILEQVINGKSYLIVEERKTLRKEYRVIKKENNENR